MKLNPLFKCFGSKWSTAKHYPKPKHLHIMEPFAGGAGYSLNFSDLLVTLAEKNQNIHNLWSYLIKEATSEDVLNIPINLPEETLITDLPLNKGQKLLLKNWQRTNNLSECWTISKWGCLPGQWTANTRNRVSKEVNKIKHWDIAEDGFKLLRDNADRLDVTWFIDPPYLFNYRYGCNNFDFKVLSELVLSLKGQVIVCEAVCPKTGAIPDYLPFEQNHTSVTSRRKETENHHSKELIYTKN